MDRPSDYDYDLPESAIAQRPLEDRSDSRLLWLHLDGSPITHHRFRDVPELLHSGDLLVVNDTRVTALRLVGRKATGARVEALLLEPREPGRYVALMKPGKRLPPGTQIEFGDSLRAEVGVDLGEGRKLLLFATDLSLDDRLQRAGATPLPPYIHETLADPERYQTVYAASPGSAAAPTAGLHFTPEVLAALKSAGVQLARVTLDVSMDTFRPVQHEDLDLHPMHGERCTLPEETAEAVRTCRGRIIAVGTTAVRTLETFATDSGIRSGTQTSKLFIRPGYRFRLVQGMFTNFHMPRTTMLMMISALAGRERVFEAYAEALRSGYRFLSFGDSMLIL